MSSYKPFYSSLWADNKFENYSPEKKLLFIFLLTNEFVEKSGIYKLSIRQISFFTGLKNSLIDEFINELINEDKIGYDFEKGIIFVKNIFRYQKGTIKNKNILLLTIKRNYELTKTFFWDEFFLLYSDDPITAEIKALLIDGSLMAHQLYININNNKNTKKEKVIKKNKTKEKSNTHEKDFEDFWDYCKVGGKHKVKINSMGSKKAARSSFEKNIASHTLDKIKDGLDAYLGHCKKNNIFTCHVSTFLNQERFLDDYGIVQDKVFIDPKILHNNQKLRHKHDEILSNIKFLLYNNFPQKRILIQNLMMHAQGEIKNGEKIIIFKNNIEDAIKSFLLENNYLIKIING